MCKAAMLWVGFYCVECGNVIFVLCPSLALISLSTRCPVALLWEHDPVYVGPTLFLGWVSCYQRLPLVLTLTAPPHPHPLYTELSPRCPNPEVSTASAHYVYNIRATPSVVVGPMLDFYNPASSLRYYLYHADITIHYSLWASH